MSLVLDGAGSELERDALGHHRVTCPGTAGPNPPPEPPHPRGMNAEPKARVSAMASVRWKDLITISAATAGAPPTPGSPHRDGGTL
jgi:hypothetical protein